MLKKFIEGLVFGSGFTLAFVAIWYLAAYLHPPVFVDPQTRTTTDVAGRAVNEIVTDPARFHNLPVDEQISLATVVAVARYEPGDDGAMRVVITEILKKDPETEFYYDIGQEFPSLNYYPRENTRYGDGVVIFFTGSPATHRYSISFSGDRIRGLGDMPLDLLREKCQSPDA